MRGRTWLASNSSRCRPGSSCCSGVTMAACCVSSLRVSAIRQASLLPCVVMSQSWRLKGARDGVARLLNDIAVPPEALRTTQRVE